MKITLVQYDIAWGSPEDNWQRAEAVIANAPLSDIYVLPEMFSTGFATDPADVAERDQRSLQWMKQTAARLNAALCGSVATCDDGSFRNRFYFVQPDGSVDFYDKRHLFTYGGEDKRYTRGDNRVVVCFRGLRILLQVCYDLRFPVFSRNHGDYDAIFYVANWPASRLAAWDTLLHARAIENQCFVAGVNRVGTDAAGCVYSGGTMLIDAYGRTMAQSADNQPDCVTADLDLEKLASFRLKFPVLSDADSFSHDSIF
ncbi:MAG: amidohydrolase [Bacteroidales bacterium]|nr:amidohydrolase [Bacteroidales bacterium]